MNELQDIWDTHHDKNMKEQQLSEAELKKQLIGRTDDAMRKINHVMRIDAIIMIVVTGLFITVTFILHLESRYTISLLLFGMTLFLGLHYWVKHYLINKHDLKNENIADTLAKKLKHLRWNKYVYIYGIPLFFFGLYSYLQSILMQTIPHTILNSTTLLKYLLGIPFTIVLFFFTKWLYERLFGRELKTLEDIIDQLD